MESILFVIQYSTIPDGKLANTKIKMKGIAFEERNIQTDFTKEQLLEAVPTARTVPQIIMDDQLIGGFTQLQEYLKENNAN